MDAYTALADPTRRDILELLAHKGQLSASQIYVRFPISHPAISQHLKVLRDTHLVDVEKRAQQRIYRINPEPMTEMESWIHQMTTVWERRFEALEKVLAAEQKKLKGKSK